MKKRRLVLFCLLSIFLLISCKTKVDVNLNEKHSLQGTVKYPDHVPISNMKVEISDPVSNTKYVDYTDDTGHFFFEELTKGTTKISFYKDGFNYIEREISVGGFDRTYDLIDYKNLIEPSYGYAFLETGKSISLIYYDMGLYHLTSTGVQSINFNNVSTQEFSVVLKTAVGSTFNVSIYRIPDNQYWDKTTNGSISSTIFDNTMLITSIDASTKWNSSVGSYGFVIADFTNKFLQLFPTNGIAVVMKSSNIYFDSHSVDLVSYNLYLK